MSIGERIKERRAHLGISQGQLGKLVGVDSVSVSRWETNRAKPDRHLFKLATILKVSAEWLDHGGRRVHEIEDDQTDATPLSKLSPEVIRRRLGNLSIEVIDIAFRVQALDDLGRQNIRDLLEKVEPESKQRIKEKGPSVRSVIA